MLRLLLFSFFLQSDQFECDRRRVRGPPPPRCLRRNRTRASIIAALPTPLRTHVDASAILSRYQKIRPDRVQQRQQRDVVAGVQNEWPPAIVVTSKVDGGGSLFHVAQNLQEGRTRHRREQPRGAIPFPKSPRQVGAHWYGQRCQRRLDVLLLLRAILHYFLSVLVFVRKVGGEGDGMCPATHEVIVGVDPIYAGGSSAERLRGAAQAGEVGR
mmetsp:Transcript_3355/g.8539  ORF Transcript_3355/g.8539 Transcript_3355/m.8539 type:complete len:213 (-) Transcript_3355:1167-1805(-)